MSEKRLESFFENYLSKEPLFRDKKILQNQHIPENIPHREGEINKLAGILAPTLRLDKPSNIFIYGKTGTGKTLVAKYVTENLMKIAEKNKLAIKVFYLNCKLKRVSDTEYRMVAELTRSCFGEEVPATGLPTDEVYKLFLNALNRKKILLIIILDEIDQLVQKSGNEILYNLTRLNAELENSEISILGISNNITFTDNLDPRVRSSLSEEEILFPPYNALQLQSILEERASKSFREDALESGVLAKCAAYAAREHGDARRALELLRVAGEITERRNESKVSIANLDQAEEKIERDRMDDLVIKLPKQSQLTLYSIFSLKDKRGKESSVFTGDVYDIYKEYCNKSKVRPLTQRRISDIIAELDMQGLINAKVISHGRYGRTRQICINIPSSNTPNVKKILGEALGI
ncbi:MAG: ORC1-type DNA replication protein [Candidatus Woesearchaeota archaeon]